MTVFKEMIAINYFYPKIVKMNNKADNKSDNISTENRAESRSSKNQVNIYNSRICYNSICNSRTTKNKNLAVNFNFVTNFVTYGLIFILLVGLVIFGAGSPVQAESLTIGGENLEYDREKGLVTITTDVKGSYSVLNFFTDEIIIKMEEGEEEIITTPQEITMEPGAFTGCDLDRPHNYFQARSIKIYPGDYLIAYHVVFYELDGRLPLFYWPILYINLDDDRANLEFEYGYSSRRGWFGKLTYNHRWLWGLAGQLYLDYYQRTGRAYGFRQQYIDSPSHEGEVYYYWQNNREEVPGLFNWEAALYHELDWLDWAGRADVHYQDYDNRYELEAESSLRNEAEDYLADFWGEYDREIFYEDPDRSRQRAEAGASYERSFSFDFWQFRDLDIFLGYELELTDYLEHQERDFQDSWLELSLAKRFANNFNLGLSYDRRSEREPGEETLFLDRSRAEADYSWGEGWSSQAAYEYSRYQEPEVELVDRWAALYTLSRRRGDFIYELVLERDAPRFPDPDEEEEDEGVSFYRWPEGNIYYQPPGNLDYQLQLGRYYEDESGVGGLRAAGLVNFSERWQPLDRLEIRSEQRLRGNVYRTDAETTEEQQIPHQITLESSLETISPLTDNWTWSNSYLFDDYRGESPFTFDELDPRNQLTSELGYSLDWMDFSLDSGYNFLEEEYLPLSGAITFLPLPGLELGLETEYDLNEGLFSRDLDFGTRYRGENLDLRITTSYDLNENEFSEVLNLNSVYRGDYLTTDTSIDYNLNDWKLEVLKNDLEFEIPGDEGLYLKNLIEYEFAAEEDRLQKATLELHKRLHCRELRFSYDHTDRAFVLSYHLDLFAGRGIGVGRGEEGMIFEFGGEEFEEEQ